MTAAFESVPGPLRVSVAILFFCVGVGLTLWSVVRGMNRVERVNELLPPKQFNPFFWGPEKNLRFRRTYKALFPGDNGLWKDIGLMFTGILLDIAALLFLFR